MIEFRDIDEADPASQARVVPLLVARVTAGGTGAGRRSAPYGVGRNRRTCRFCAKAGGVTTDTDTLRVHIPLTFRKRGGRPRILPPKKVEPAMERGHDPHVLRAIGRAWRWRRQIERGEVTALADLAADGGFSDRYVSRLIRLAWLSPKVLERLVLQPEPTVLSLKDLCGVAELPWVGQPGRVFD